MEIWSEAAKLIGQTLQTLTQGKLFDIIGFTDTVLLLRLHKGCSRLLNCD